MLPRPSCGSCRHFDLERFHESKGFRCAAYPDGIPEPLYLGYHDHKTSYPGDHGILYLPRVQSEAEADASRESEK